MQQLQQAEELQQVEQSPSGLLPAHAVCQTMHVADRST